MASLTIGGQVHALALRPRDVIDAEERVMRRGGRSLLTALSTKNGEGVSLAGYECEALCWGAWRRRMPDDRVAALLEQFYGEGGTLFELHREICDALVDSGFLGRRAPPADPPSAKASGVSGTPSPS